jgi:hypothetical protein
MFGKQTAKNALSWVRHGLQTHCDADEFSGDDSGSSLIEQADEQLNMKNRIRTPMSYENLKNGLMGAGSVNAFDGFRLMVVKQVNCNTASQHTFMLGSSQTQNQPYYNYTLILPLDDRQETSARIRSDLDFNIDAELNFPLTEGVPVKAALSLNEQGTALVVDADFANDNSATQVTCNIGPQSSLALNFMQALTPSLSLGGMNSYTFKDNSIKSALAGVYDSDGHTAAATLELDSMNVSSERLSVLVLYFEW